MWGQTNSLCDTGVVDIFGHWWDATAATGERHLEPGEVLKINSAPQNLANEHHYRLKPEASVNALIVLLVEGVMFADGTTY